MQVGSESHTHTRSFFIAKLRCMYLGSRKRVHEIVHRVVQGILVAMGVKKSQTRRIMRQARLATEELKLPCPARRTHALGCLSGIVSATKRECHAARSASAKSAGILTGFRLSSSPVWLTATESEWRPGSPLPHLHWDSGPPFPHLRRDCARLCHICTGRDCAQIVTRTVCPIARSSAVAYDFIRSSLATYEYTKRTSSSSSLISC